MRPRRKSSFVDVAPHISNGQSNDKRTDLLIESLETLNQHIMDFAVAIVTPEKTDEKKKIEVIKEKVVKPVIKSFFAKFILISMTILNVCLLYEETKSTERSEIFIFLEILCFMTIVVQIIMKILHNPAILNHSFWIYLDMATVVSTFMYHVTPTDSHVHTFFMYSRLLICLRLVEMFQPSRRLVLSMGKTAGITIVVLFFIAVFAFFTAYLGYTLFSRLSSDWWGSLTQSLYTIFIILMQSGLPGYHAIEPTRKMSSMLFYLAVSFIGSFVIMNALTGVSYLSLLKAKRDEQRKRELRELKRKADENNRAVAERLVSSKRKQIERAPSRKKMKEGRIRVVERHVIRMRQKMEKLEVILKAIEEITEEVANREAVN